uniref:Reverse transcriptase domain-containing protein n=1 Tax=Tanacetum cinerariifolium TaxID=118510 RepID=A0A6L2KIH8_TANCI|nr:reverse transcriptase domain-containing protein [Tanacetum cinerariifolium]
MQTRSSSRLVSNPSSNPTSSANPNPKGRNRRRSKQRIEDFNLEELSPHIVTMADQRTMAQLLQAPTEGYKDAIVVPAITPDNFVLKHGLLTLVQNKHEAWDGFKDLLRACPHHGFSKLYQLDMFYNALNSKDQDSLNFAVVGNFLDKMPCECLAIKESKSKVHYSRNKPVVVKVSMNTSTFGISPDVAELKDMVKALLLDKKSQSPAPVKAVEESCVTCGGAHSYHNFPATDGNVYRDNIQEFVSQAFAVNYNQGYTSYHPPMMSNQIRPPGSCLSSSGSSNIRCFKEDFSSYVKANDAVLRNMQTQGQNMQNQLTNLTDLMTKFVNSNSASTSSSGTLPSNTIANPRSDLKEITTQSGVSYDGPQIPPSTSFLPKVVENEPKATKDIMNPTNNGNTEDIQPQVVQFESPVLTSKPVTSLIYEPKIALPVVRYLVQLELQKMSKLRSFLKTGIALIDMFVGELTIRVGNKAITFNLDQTSRYSANYSDMTAKRIDVIDMACKDYSQEVLGFFNTISSGNPTSYYDLIVSTTSLTLTPFGNSDFLLEEVDAFLAIEDDPTFSEFYQPYLDPEGDILLLEAFLNDDPSPPLSQGNYLPEVRKELKICEAKSDKSSVDEPPEVELKDLPPHLEYAFWEGNDKLLVIIAKDLSVKEKTALITVLKSHKQAIAWKLSDIKDQEKTTFTCPYRTFAYRRMPFGLCNAPGTFQRCMMAIFHDMIEKTIEVFMDDFFVFGNSFQSCLSYLERMMKRCEDTNLCLKWEKSHFMVKEGIVLGHKISKQGIEVDKDNVAVITKLPHPTTIKDWDMPFELMFDASDFAIGAVLGQRQDKHFRPIHHASKTMTESSEGVYLARKPLKSSRLAIIDPQETSGQVEVSNRGLKCILERAVGGNRVSWSDKLDDALWTLRTAYKTPIGCTPYKLVYRKLCHLPVELEHKAYWALKHANFDLKIAGDHRKVQINELNELYNQAYESSLIYKEITKRLHDSKIKNRVFNIGD